MNDFAQARETQIDRLQLLEMRRPQTLIYAYLFTSGQVTEVEAGATEFQLAVRSTAAVDDVDVYLENSVRSRTIDIQFGASDDPIPFTSNQISEAVVGILYLEVPQALNIVDATGDVQANIQSFLGASRYRMVTLRDSTGSPVRCSLDLYLRERGAGS